MTAEHAEDRKVVIDILPHKIWHNMIMHLSVNDRAAFQSVCKLFMRLFPLSSMSNTSDADTDLAVTRFLDETELKRFNALRVSLQQPLQLKTDSPVYGYGSRTRLIKGHKKKLLKMDTKVWLSATEMEPILAVVDAGVWNTIFDYLGLEDRESVKLVCKLFLQQVYLSSTELILMQKSVKVTSSELTEIDDAGEFLDSSLEDLEYASMALDSAQTSRGSAYEKRFQDDQRDLPNSQAISRLSNLEQR